MNPPTDPTADAPARTALVLPIVSAATAEARLANLRDHIRAAGCSALVLSDPLSLAYWVGYEKPWEDYPADNPFVAYQELAVIGLERAILIVPDFYAAVAEPAFCDVRVYTTYDYLLPPAGATHFKSALAAVLEQVRADSARFGIEGGSLSVRAADALTELGLDLVRLDAAVSGLRSREGSRVEESIRSAARLADVALSAVKQFAAEGISEAELCGLVQAALNTAAGRRIATFLNITSGPASASAPWESTGRMLGRGDLVLTDVAPWFGGAWGDSANSVVVGPPTAEHRRVFSAVQRAYELSVALCIPGALACDIDRQVRESLAEFGECVYAHHTGHSIGAAWAEDPRIVPYSDDRLEEGMVIACEPAVYRPGWGGIRIEGMCVVKAGGAEMLTQFEHTL